MRVEKVIESPEDAPLVYIYLDDEEDDDEPLVLSLYAALELRKELNEALRDY